MFTPLSSRKTSVSASYESMFSSHSFLFCTTSGAVTLGSVDGFLFISISQFYNMQSHSFIVYPKAKTFVYFSDRDIIIFIYQLFDFFVILRC